MASGFRDKGVLEMPKRGTAEHPAFNGIDDLRIPRSIRENSRWSQERKQAWVDAENEKWRVVETCENCGKELIALEVEPHKFSHVKSSRARQILGMIYSYRTHPEDLEEIKEFLAKHG